MTLKVALRPLSLPLNRFVDLFAAALAERGIETVEYGDDLASLVAADVAVLHWPDEFLGPARRRESLAKLARIRLARAAGTRLVWVAHNRAPHAGTAAHALVPRAFLGQLDGIVHLSQASRAAVREAWPVAGTTRELVTVHPAYPPLAPARPFRRPAPDRPVALLNFGMIKRYKGLGELVVAMDGLADAEARLVVTGMRHDDDIADALLAAAATRPDIEARITHAPLSDAEVEAAVDAADGVVLPYRDILNSGAALLALSRNRPVLVPAMGAMPELSAAVGPGWVHLYEPPLSAGALGRFARAVRAPRAAAPDLSRHTWPRLGDEVAAFLHGLCADRKAFPQRSTANFGRNSIKDNAPT